MTDRGMDIVRVLVAVLALACGGSAWGQSEGGDGPGAVEPEGEERGGDGGEDAGGGDGDGGSDGGGALEEESGRDGPPEAGEEVIVRYEDGRRLRGEFVSLTESTLTLRIASVEVEIPVAAYERIIRLESPLARYRRMAAMVGEDVDRILDLAEWARRKGLLDPALEQIERALVLEPRNAEARSMRKLIEQQRFLEERRRARESRRGGEEEDERGRRRGEGSGDRAFERRPLPGDFPLLTERQINLIKVYEVDLNDPPTMLISRETVERFLRDYASDPLVPTTREGRRAVLGMEPAELLDLMFRVRARELYPEVEVVGNPSSMEMFRDRVHAGWLVNAAATTRCHGGPNAGRLMLTNRRPTSDASVYTNFVILDRFVTSAGEPLINWQEPERSPLLQMGLPRDDAEFPHPDVAGWRPVFRSRESRSFRNGVRWIESMYRPRPEYGIEYEPPRPSEPVVRDGPVER